MDYATTSATSGSITTGHSNFSSCHALMDEWENILVQHRAAHPDVYRLVDLQKKREMTPDPCTASSEKNAQSTHAAANTETKIRSLFGTELRGAPLRALIQESHREIRQRILACDADIIPRTQPHNECVSNRLIKQQ